MHLVIYQVFHIYDILERERESIALKIAVRIATIAKVTGLLKLNASEDTTLSF